MSRKTVYAGIMIAAGVLLFIVMFYCIATGDLSPGYQQNADTSMLGDMMFNNYGLALIGVGLVLFVSMLGGVYLAKEEEEEE